MGATRPAPSTRSHADGATKLSSRTSSASPSSGATALIAETGGWSIRGSAELFAFQYDAFDGLLYDVFGGIDYSFTDLVSLGLGFNAVQFDLEFDDNSLTGDLDWGYAGAMLYLKFDF